MSRAEAGATGSPQQVQPADAADAAGPAEPVPVEPPPPPPRPVWPGWDPLLRVGGLLVAVVATVVTGVLEVLLTTLRAGDAVSIWRGDAIGSGGGPLLGLSILLAVVANYAIAWFAVRTTGRRWALGPPWALWTLMMMFAAGVRTTQGDYLLGGDDWVGLVMILAGSLSFAVYAYRLILSRLPQN